MAKKKPSLSTVVAFMSNEAQARVEAQVQRSTTMLPLASILPDPGQPRRLLPDDLTEAVVKGTLSPVQAVQEWLRRAEGEGAEATTLRHNAHELKRLADSIERHGLISPVSVRQPRPDEAIPANVEYMIVTGERRYWAQVYLVSEGKQIHEGETIANPAQIKATIAPPGVTIRAHQLIENLLREDINAMERARGLWALRYELSGLRQPAAYFGDYSESETVNHGSPQAADSQHPEAVNDDSVDVDERDQNHQLVPWARVEEVLGISKRYRIFTTSVLNLSPEAQAIIEKHGLAERTIRPIVQKLRDKPALQLQALRQLVAWQTEAEDEGPGRSIVASVKELVDQLLAAEVEVQRQSTPTRSVSSAPVIRLQNRVRQTLDFLNRLKPTDRIGLTKALRQDEFAELMIDLRNLYQQIDALLQATTSPQTGAKEIRPSTSSAKEVTDE